MNEKTENILAERIFKKKGDEFRGVSSSIRPYSQKEKEVLQYAAEKMIERENRNMNTFHAITPIVMSLIAASLGFVFKFSSGDSQSQIPDTITNIVFILCLIALIGCAIYLMVSYYRVAKASEKRYDEFVELAVACYDMSEEKTQYETTTETVENVSSQSVKKQKKQ